MGIREKLIKLSEKNVIFEKCRIMLWHISDYPERRYTAKKRKKRFKTPDKSVYKELLIHKNTHVGERCFIIATGPSLTFEDLSLLKNEITFGMNSLPKIYNSTEWRPTYFGIQDKWVYGKMEDTIIQYYSNANNVFVADTLGKYYDIPQNFIQFPYERHYRKYGGISGEYVAEFSDDAYNIVYDGYTITYSLIEIAVYMGFREIYLLGVDCNYPVGGKNHFVESGHIDKYAASNPIRMRIGYSKAKEYADSHGIKIINCTRGGMLEVFPRKTLEEVLEVKNENSSHCSNEAE